jgi:hypothetical protein
MIKKDIRGVSLMLSYVLIIAIALGTSIGVYNWIKTISNADPSVDCKEDTSILLSDYTCDSAGITLKIRNSGRFNVSGFVFLASNDSGKEPVIGLILKDSSGQPVATRPGIYYFSEPLKPNSEPSLPIKFSNDFKKGTGSTGTISKIEKIQLQPFILIKKKMLVCKNAVIKQRIDNCVFA